MQCYRKLRWISWVVLALGVVAVPQYAVAQSRQEQQVQRQQTQPYNNAPVWRDVRQGEPGPYTTTQVRGVDTKVLIESSGQLWREVRNGPVIVYGGWLLIITPLLIALFYMVRGQIKLRQKPTGRLIPRFSAWDRIIHWATAITFLALAVTGLITMFGKHVLLPVFGYTMFSWLATLSKNLHNFIGPLFALCTVLIFVTFMKDNLPRAYDWLWIRKAGGMLSGEHVPSGRFNAGEKVWFWTGVTLLGIVASASGLILNFANFEQGRLLMQQANIIHAVSAVLFIAMSLGHIYIGTIGTEGAYASMRTGSVDETWAKEHHEYWYNEVKARQTPALGGAPSTVVASAMTEGWKL